MDDEMPKILCQNFAEYYRDLMGLDCFDLGHMQPPISKEHPNLNNLGWNWAATAMQWLQFQLHSKYMC